MCSRKAYLAEGLLFYAYHSKYKDFFQLCNDETSIYRPIQDKLVTKQTILDEFKIHPNNKPNVLMKKKTPES